MSLMPVIGIEVPDDKERVWRYMGFSKFVSLLATDSLYFPRIDKFEDRLEGVLPDNVRHQYGSSMNQWFEENKNKLFVSCWHFNPVEFVLMWKAYSGGEPIVAVESTIGLMKQWLTPLPDAYVVGKAQYIDFNTDAYPSQSPGAVNVVAQAYHKRKFFESEKELRVVMNPFANTALAAERDKKVGIPVSVNLESLVERIRVVSGAAPWFIETVRAVYHKFGGTKEVLPSDI